jgi:hypothetical protein
MNETHLVPQFQGRICREWLAFEGGSYFLLVEEEIIEGTTLLLYGWDAGWEVEEGFRMGLLDDYVDEVMSRFGQIIDVGESDNREAGISVVEEGAQGFWVSIYEWNFFWEFWRFEVAYHISDGRYVDNDLVEEVEVEEVDDDEEDCKAY